MNYTETQFNSAKETILGDLQFLAKTNTQTTPAERAVYGLLAYVLKDLNYDDSHLLNLKEETAK